MGTVAEIYIYTAIYTQLLNRTFTAAFTVKKFRKILQRCKKSCFIIIF